MSSLGLQCEDGTIEYPELFEEQSTGSLPCPRDLAKEPVETTVSLFLEGHGA